MPDLAKQIAEQIMIQANRTITSSDSLAAGRFHGYTDAEFDMVRLLVKQKLLSDADGARIAMFLDQMTDYVDRQCC